MKTVWQNKKVLILGAARQGLALARFLADRGTLVTVNDSHSASEMQSLVESNANPNVQWFFGSHPIDLLENLDMLCVSGGVPLDLPIIQEAVRLNIPLSNDSQIFMENVPCPVISITGSAGKTTTTALLGNIARTHYKNNRKVWVGGNIGLPLIDQVESITKDDLVILELSSFQLELMSRAPQISAVLNITPNHLDRHKTIEAYTAAKARILTYQNERDSAILGMDNPRAASLVGKVKGRLITFSDHKSTNADPGCYLNGNDLYLFDGEKDHFIMHKEDIKLRGEHNVKNVLAACACAFAEGITIEAMQEGTQNFKGIAHRLEYVKEINGVTWYNDSIATAPERTMAAIQSFSEPLVLLLGGRDKNLPWEDLANLIKHRVDHVVVFGEAVDIIINALNSAEDNGRDVTIDYCPKLVDAVNQAHMISKPGDIVLLAPGGTSYDEFKDFEDRGESFRTWVNQLT